MKWCSGTRRGRRAAPSPRTWASRAARWPARWRACEHSVTAEPRRCPGRAQQHHRFVRADLEGAAGQVSEPDRRACLAGTARGVALAAATRWCGSASGSCVRGPRRRRCRALRPGPVSKPKWTSASMTSTSRAKAAGACTCSAICSATRGGNTCAGSNRWTW